MRYLLGFIFFIFSYHSFSQNSFSCIVKDSLTSEPVPFANISLEGIKIKEVTDDNGNASLIGIPDGDQIISVSFVGYQTLKRKIHFPYNGKTPFVFWLVSRSENLEEVIVTTTRTNSRIDDLNTKVEVLGQDDMDEESSLVPGNITSILGDLSIITIQRTNPVNGNEAIRMQGLDPRYTQIMRDGLPLYGGFSGSLGVLSIPPLDLKQVEIIKGSASTLYGGGAISGLINLISKEPVDSSHTVLSVNCTSLREYNINAFTSQKRKKLGLTVFAGTNMKSPIDINGDEFAEVPKQTNLCMHPRIFYEFNEKNKLVIGLSAIADTRAGGDIQAIKNGADTMHTFLQSEKTFRNSLDITYTSRLSDKQILTCKSAGSFFQRSLNHSGFLFKGTQYSTYTELNDCFSAKKHMLVVGANLISEAFFINKSDPVMFHGYEIYTLGLFAQDDWQFAKKISLQSGIRYDRNNHYGNFFLPRLALLYKPYSSFSIRLSGGTGYKIPGLFDYADPSQRLLDISFYVLPEKSYGVNSDINYHTLVFDGLGIQLNQAFYYTHIDNPIVLATNGVGQYFIDNGTYFVNSYGTDTYMRLSYKDFELYLGYNHTESLQEHSNWRVNMPFNPKDKFSTMLTYEIESMWRMGIEQSLVGNQYVYNNRKVNDYWFFAAMIERKFKYCSFVVNCENLLDVRQSKFESLVSGPLNNPVFKPVWAPLEGRVVNVSVRFTIS